MKTKQTAESIASLAHSVRPEIVYRAAQDGESVAAWSTQLNRWVPVVGKTIMPGCEWVSLDYELLINGKPAFDQSLYGDKPEVRS